MAKIVILTSRTGGGHVSLAEALHDRLAADHAVDIVDPQPGLVHWHYRMVSRHALWLWAAEFKSADTPARSLLAHRVFSLLFARNVGGLLLRTQPDLVISTYPFLTYEVTRAMRGIGMRRPFVTLLSDPVEVHQSWLTERGTAATFAPTQETYAQAASAGFAPERLHFTGWPVRQQFYCQPESVRVETLTRLNLRPDRFTVFLQGGGEGAARFARTVETLRTLPGLQILLAAGTNQALLEKFSGLENVRPLAFTKTIAPFMAAADVVMGKAGPNVLFESVTLGRPFIATSCIPGQEEVNLDFIRRHRLGWVAREAGEQCALIRALASHPDRLAAVRAAVDRYRQGNTRAVETIVPLIRAVLGQVPAREYAGRLNFGAGNILV
jgi:processive 1,2-diacylglycerol beta-glucosyltransferase